MTSMRKLAAAISVAIVVWAGGSAADSVFVVTLNGDQNVPFVAGISAEGSATLVLNEAQTELSYTITYEALSTDEYGSHIHNAGPRNNGPIVHALPLGNPKVGVWMIPPEMVVELFGGRLYINVHSEMYPLGEIRGNIPPDPIATQEHTWGSIKALFTD